MATEAGLLDLFPSDIWDAGWWCLVYVGLVLEEEIVDHLLDMLGISIVYLAPGCLYDVVDFFGVCCISPWWLTCYGRPLDGLERLGELLLDTSVDVWLCMLASELKLCGLLRSLLSVMIKLLKSLEMLPVMSGDG